MAGLREAIIDILRDDRAVLLADLPGGVHGVAIDPVATPAAFTSRAGSARRLLPCATVALGGVGVSFAGTALIAGLSGVTLGATRSVSVWLYEPWPGRAVIERAKLRVIHLLHRRQVAADGEGTVVLAFVGDLGDGPRDEDLAASVEQVRFRAATMIGREAAPSGGGA